MGGAHHVEYEKSDIYPKRAMSILRVWLVVFAFVGTQMVWTLRPLVGSKDKPFELFRKSRDGNFYQAVVYAARELIHDRDGSHDNRAGRKAPASPATNDL